MPKTMLVTVLARSQETPRAGDLLNRAHLDHTKV